MICKRPCPLDREIEALQGWRGLRAFLLGSALAQAGLSFFPYTTQLNWHAIAAAVLCWFTWEVHLHIERRWARAKQLCKACEEKYG